MLAHIANRVRPRVGVNKLQLKAAPSNLVIPLRTFSITKAPSDNGDHQARSLGTANENYRKAQGVSDGKDKGLNPMKTWTVKDVLQWMEKTKEELLMKHKALFETNQINGRALVSLTEEDLTTMGISILGERKTILSIISDLKGQTSSSSEEIPAEEGRFWSALVKGDFRISDGKIELPEGVHWLQEASSVLFVRTCDKELFDIISAIERQGIRRDGALVTGNPGIGKSWFLMYCLYRFSQQKRTIIYVRAGSRQVWLLHGDGSIQLFYHLDKVARFLANRQTILLNDPIRGGFPIEASAFTVVSSSPNKERYKEFLIRVEKKFYMPCWTRKEIKMAAPTFGLDEKIAMDRFDKFGGIPRHIFGDQTLQSELTHTAIETCNWNTLLVGSQTLEALDNEKSHRLFQYVLPEFTDYRTYTIWPASLDISRAMTLRMLSEAPTIFRAIGLFTNPNSAFASIRGNIYEVLMHYEIYHECGISLLKRNLETDQEVEHLDFPVTPLQTHRFDHLADAVAQPAGTYLLPNAQNFGSADSIVVHQPPKGKRVVYLLQATVAATHPIHFDKIKEITQAFGEETDFKFLFVVPSERFKNWKKQKPHETSKLKQPPNVTQYVMQLPWATPLIRQANSLREDRISP